MVIERGLHLAVRELDDLVLRARVHRPEDVRPLQRQREELLELLDRIVEEVR